ncbi:MAG: CdaR family protein [Treponema sp.]|nr:CdaR family protein [Treponema sp.]
MTRAKLISIIIEKWPVKVLSLAAAIVIAVFYRMNTLEARFFTAPLLVEPSETLLPASFFARAVRISMRGESAQIQQIMEDDVEAFIDLGRYTNTGNYRVPVQIRKKGSALGIEPLEITVLPIDIPMFLDQRVTRNISVFPVFQGTIAEGYELISQTLIPASVVADGPGSILDTHLDFNTEIINLDGRNESFSIMVNIINENHLISIHGSNMLEYRGIIRRIVRERQEIPRQIISDSLEETGAAGTAELTGDIRE